MDDDSIREDVSQTDTPETPQDTPQDTPQEAPQEAKESNDPVSRRERLMRQAAEKRKVQRDQERRAAAEMNNPDASAEEIERIVAPPRDESSPESLEDEDGADETPRAEESPGDRTDDDHESRSPDQAPTGWHTREDGTRVRRLKVNGEFREITEAEYDRLASKELAGDQKLRIANDMSRRLQERERELARREAALQAPPPQGVSNEDLEAALSAYHEAVYEGDTDAAKAKLKDILSAGRQTSTPNLEALADEAATRAEQRLQQRNQQQAVQKGWESFKTSYPEIVGDDGRLAYADARLKAVRAEHPDWTPDQQILEAGRIAAEELGLKEVKPTSQEPVNTEATSAREAAKRNLKPIPKAGSTKHKPQEKPQVDMSPAAKIARMRSARAIAS